MSNPVNIFTSVQEINKILEDQGASIVQKILMPGKRILYGYLPQAVFDAVNSVLKPEGWRYVIVEPIAFESEVVVRAIVKIGSRECEHFGGMKIINGDHGSAYKGAVTDALQKALSMFGIGNKAYRGELKNTFENNSGGAGIVNQDVASLSAIKKEIEKLTDRAAGIEWWKNNASQVQSMSKPDLEEIVRLLGEKK